MSSLLKLTVTDHMLLTLSKKSKPREKYATPIKIYFIDVPTAKDISRILDAIDDFELKLCWLDHILSLYHNNIRNFTDKEISSIAEHRTKSPGHSSLIVEYLFKLYGIKPRGYLHHTYIGNALLRCLDCVDRDIAKTDVVDVMIEHHPIKCIADIVVILKCFTVSVMKNIALNSILRAWKEKILSLDKDTLLIEVLSAYDPYRGDSAHKTITDLFEQHQPKVVVVKSIAPQQKEKEKEKERGSDYLDDKTLCSICMENERTTLLDDCKHLCVCDTCSKSITKNGITKCPVCRKDNKGTTRVFWS